MARPRRTRSARCDAPFQVPPRAVGRAATDNCSASRSWTHAGLRGDPATTRNVAASSSSVSEPLGPPLLVVPHKASERHLAVSDAHAAKRGECGSSPAATAHSGPGASTICDTRTGSAPRNRRRASAGKVDKIGDGADDDDPDRNGMQSVGRRTTSNRTSGGSPTLASFTAARVAQCKAHRKVVPHESGTPGGQSDGSHKRTLRPPSSPGKKARTPADRTAKSSGPRAPVPSNASSDRKARPSLKICVRT